MDITDDLENLKTLYLTQNTLKVDRNYILVNITFEINNRMENIKIKTIE